MPREIEEQNNLSYIINEKKFCISYQVGEILEINLRSETKIVGRGGGGRVSTVSGNVSGYISPVKIDSHTETKTNIWVKLPSGEEKEWVFDGEISARVGHRLVFVYVSDDRGSNFVFSFVNISIKKVFYELNLKELQDKLNVLASPPITEFAIGGIFLGGISAFLGYKVMGFGGSGIIITFFLTLLSMIMIGYKPNARVEAKNAEIEVAIDRLWNDLVAVPYRIL